MSDQPGRAGNPTDPPHMLFEWDGIPVGRDRLVTWLRLPGYRFVARTIVKDSAQPGVAYDVATVWAGGDPPLPIPQFPDRPVTFETVVFSETPDRDENYMAVARYASAGKASEGHDHTVAGIVSRLRDPIVLDAEVYGDLAAAAGRTMADMVDLCRQGGEIVYHGWSNGHTTIIEVETAGGQSLGLLPHVARHSPTGMRWGYAGSGAADCAQSILLSAVDDPLCPECVGTSLVTYQADGDIFRAYDPTIDNPAGETVMSCMGCDSGYRTLPHQAFKFAFVASWSDQWRITRSEVRAWLELHQQSDLEDEQP